ncbi:MAG: hypothetical protein IJJ23_01315 [Clostridia bacterium]|nr:hypothetical protein [Clostridia bacterium]
MQYGLIGAKLGHSYSVPIHNRLGHYDYRLYEMDETALRDLLIRRDFKGLNITIPYKRLACEMCDELSDAAKAIGSVNTVVVRPDGRLYGHNTDIGGFIALAEKAGVVIAGRKVAILGSGGTSLTAQYACRTLGARSVVVVSRGGPIDYEALYRDHADIEVLVNTTPLGMYPKNGTCAVDISRFPRLGGVLDVVYNPDKTALILDAEARGLPCAGGLYMLVAQARESAELFIGQAIPPSRTDEIYAWLRDQSLNVILIGMPGCGKSTVGRALAARMNRPFIDCDEEVERRTDMSIPDIFARQGESAFRSLEARVIADVCAGKGAVIATGGGSVLSAANVRAMRQNGRILLLSRSLDQLSLEGRPLSKSRDALESMWSDRGPKYLNTADCTIENDASPDDVAARAEEAFHENIDR